MTEQQLYRRLVRRSTFRSRSTAVVATLSVLTLGALYAGVELVLAALELPPLLVAPADALAAINKPEPMIAAIVAGGLAVIGLVLLIASITPGRRGRHELPNDRMAVIVDDGVLAGALGKVVTRAAGVPASRVSSMVSRRRGSVRVIATSGAPLDAPALETAARSLVSSLDPRPGLRVDIDIASGGVVGS